MLGVKIVVTAMGATWYPRRGCEIIHENPERKGEKKKKKKKRKKKKKKIKKKKLC